MGKINTYRKSYILFSIKIRKFGTLIPRLTLADFTVFNGLYRTFADTCHAVGAIALPYRPILYKTYVVKRAYFTAFTAANTCI